MPAYQKAAGVWGLATAGGARKNCAVVALHDRINNVGRRLLVDHCLLSVWRVNTVEGECLGWLLAVDGRDLAGA